VLWMCRILVPILQSGHFWEVFLITPSFLLTAPWWLAGTTYLTALTGGAVPGILLLLTSELRLIFRGQSYIESLQVQHPTCTWQLLLFTVLSHIQYGTRNLLPSDTRLQ